jgi:glycerophosphoryl diester phosphodiesterase
MTVDRWRRDRPLSIAHQGGEAEAPPSTLFAMATAVAGGADALELDVHATADGHLVVLHDPTVDRTTDGSGAVDALTLEQVRRLDAAHWFVPGQGVVRDRPDDAYALRGVTTGAVQPPTGFTAADFTIPTLAEVFERFDQTLINVDIKQTAPATRPYEDRLADLTGSFGREDRTIVASFSDQALDAFRALAPAAATSASPAEVLAFWTAVQDGHAPSGPLGYEALQVPLNYQDVTVVDASFVRVAHECGLVVHVWTIDDEATMVALLDLGVDGVVTNRPSVLERVLSGRFSQA